MQKIIKDFNEKKFRFNVNDIYTATGDITNFIFNFDNVKEKENHYMTNGPEKNTTAIFEIKQYFDNVSSVTFEIHVEGISSNDEDIITITINPKFQMIFKHNTNIIYQSFTNYYLTHIKTKFEEKGNKEVKNLINKFQEFVKEEYNYRLHRFAI